MRQEDVGRLKATTDFHQLLIEKLYSQRILNNSHRGDFVEMMVLSALGPEWRHVGLGWYLWDLQRGDGANRGRVQVKAMCCAPTLGENKMHDVAVSVE
jgi:hypothetical protein